MSESSENCVTNSNEMNGTEKTEKTSACGWWFQIQFSQQELVILHSTFSSVRPRLENVAVIAFSKLFKKHPEAFNIFVNNNVLPSELSDVIYSWETKQHGLRVLNMVEKCLNRMDRPDSLRSVLTGLAQSHVGYGMSPFYILALMGYLKETMTEEIKNIYCQASDNDFSLPAIEAAWDRFFQTFGFCFVAEFLKVQHTGGADVLSSPPASPRGFDDDQKTQSGKDKITGKPPLVKKKSLIKTVRDWVS